MVAFSLHTFDIWLRFPACEGNATSWIMELLVVAGYSATFGSASRPAKGMLQRGSGCLLGWVFTGIRLGSAARPAKGLPFSCSWPRLYLGTQSGCEKGFWFTGLGALLDYYLSIEVVSAVDHTWACSRRVRYRFSSLWVESWLLGIRFLVPGCELVVEFVYDVAVRLLQEIDAGAPAPARFTRA